MRPIRAIPEISTPLKYWLQNFGGEGGIRTLEAGLHPLNRLAGGPFQPLKHLSV